jgi:hypothetical protein
MDSPPDETPDEEEAPNEGILRKLGSSKLASEVGKTMAVEMFFARQQGFSEAESQVDDFDGGDGDGDGE